MRSPRKAHNSWTGWFTQPCRLCLLVALAIARLAPHATAAADEFARVKQVYDGDSVLLEDGRRVRYLGINSPEFREPFYLKAKRFNESLVLGREIRLELDQERTDAADRLLAYVYAGDQMVNAALVQEGLAHAFFIGPNRRYNSLILQLQGDAKQHRRGIWSGRGRTKDLKITTLRVPDPANPEPYAPYVRIANLSHEAIRLGGYVLSNESGHRFIFPDVTVEPGYTVLVVSTGGPDRHDRGQLTVRWPGQVSIWDSSEDTAFLMDPSGTVVDTFHHKAPGGSRPPRTSRNQQPGRK